MLHIIFVTIVAIVLAGCLFLHKKNQYWNRKGIPTPKPTLLFGNYTDYFLVKKNLGETLSAICAQYPGAPVIGTYFGTEPAVVVQDPELLRLIFTKDFYYFNSRELAAHTQREPFYKNMFNEANDTWRALRQAFNPLFSPAKMKNMFHLIHANSKALTIFLEEKTTIDNVHQVKDITSRFTMDCIASCVFGVEGKTLDDSIKPNIFKEVADEIVNFTTKRQLKYILRQVWPNVFYATGNLGSQKQVEEFFTHLLQGVFKERNYVPGSRQDFVDYLLNIKSKGYVLGDAIINMKTKGANEKVQLEVTDAMLVAQCMVFFGAGFETSASTMGFTMFELAKHPDILERVLAEIDQYLLEHDSELTYECISELPYLEACIHETMRLYTVLGAITREVVEDYMLPSGLVLQKGVRVFVPTYQIHSNPDYFPDPETYRPERFLGANKNKIKPYTYFPFGEGPRICIGMRFALMQMCAGLVTVLRARRVALPAGQPRAVRLEPRAFVTTPTAAIRLQFTPRS